MSNAAGGAPVDDRVGVERLKEESEFLRGSLAEEFAAEGPSISEDAYQLLKFHGSYQQDDRDLRNERRKAKEPYAFQFMLRLRLPGGDVHPELYLALDRLADTCGNGTIRLTTRQSVQMHGVLKADVRTVIRTVNAQLSSTLGACGDVNRNVMASPAPYDTPVYRIAREAARRVSDHLLPRTKAYAEVWLDGEEVARVTSPEPADDPAGVADAAGAPAPVEGSSESTQETEPIYGPTYLPRKFKTCVAVPGDNSVDLFSHDLALVPIVEDQLVGWNVYVGGGLGRTHRKPDTFPRLADPLGFVGPDDLLRIAEGVVIVQRDHGDRTNRRQARLKYLIHKQGIDWFRTQVEQVTGLALEPARPVPWHRSTDLLGWRPQGDGRWFYGLRVLNGRIVDRDDVKIRTAFRELVTELGLHLRITPNQNAYLLDVAADQRGDVDAILRRNGVQPSEETRGLRQLAMACPALPTCGLAIAEAERVLPEVLDSLQPIFDEAGVGEAPPILRMTGCPNGCARPYVAEIGLVGDAVDRYQVWLGGNLAGTRLATEVATRVPRSELPALLRPIIERWSREREADEGLGDFIERIGADQLVPPEALPQAPRSSAVAAPS